MLPGPAPDLHDSSAPDLPADPLLEGEALRVPAEL
jgi:hypothetical protein